MCGVPCANDCANAGSTDFFSTFGFHVLVKENDMEFKDKIMLPCSLPFIYFSLDLEK